MPRSTGYVECRCVSSPLAPSTPLRSPRGARSLLLANFNPSPHTNPNTNPDHNPNPNPDPNPNLNPNPTPNPNPHPNPHQVFSMGHPSGPDSSNGDLLGRGAPPDDEGQVTRAAQRVVLPVGAAVAEVGVSTYSNIAIAVDGRVFTWGDAVP